MAINQVVAGAAALTTSATAFSASVPGAGQTFAVASDAGYPVSGRFVVQLNRGQDDEEKVLVSSRSGTTFTVETRGYDGTTAQSHTNPTVNLILPATVVNALIDHADDNEADPHATKLLNNTRHDTTSRHTYGAAFGTRPTPSSVGTANAAGSGSTPSAGDHVHAIAAGAINSSGMFAAGVVDAAAIATDAVGSAEIAAGAVGSSEIATDAVGADEIAAGAVGTAELASGVYGSPASIGTANADGAATTVARSNHVHDVVFTEVQQEESGTNQALTASFAALLSFSLTAGTWRIGVSVESSNSTTSRTTHSFRVQNTTDASTVIQRNNCIDGEVSNNQHVTTFFKTVTIAATKTMELQGQTSSVTGTQLASEYIMEAIRVRSVA